MKNKISKLLIGVAIMIFPFSLLFGCGGSEKKVVDVPNLGSVPIHDGPVEVTPLKDYVEGAELLCLADSKEQAEEIAKLYGIELVEYSYGVATFHTTEDPHEVIERGLDKGYPELSINGYSQLY